MLRIYNDDNYEYNSNIFKKLFAIEKDITDNKGWTPLMYICDKDMHYSYTCKNIAPILRIFP